MVEGVLKSWCSEQTGYHRSAEPDRCTDPIIKRLVGDLISEPSHLEPSLAAAIEVEVDCERSVGLEPVAVLVVVRFYLDHVLGQEQGVL